MKQIMGAPEMRQRIANMGLLPIDPPSLDETDRYIKSETAKFGVLLKALGLAGTQ
jgi:tripartite-type tricarboxylate transporter receptor subunit TctC